MRIKEYDIVIAGGGPGGFGAAVAAARAGAKVLVLEREGCLGGGATTMMVNPFMPHTTDCWRTAGNEKIINAGVYLEVLDRLKARGATHPTDPRRFEDEALKLVLDEIAAEAGVSVIFHAALFDARAKDGRIQSARFAHNGGPINAKGKVFIDATGDGLLAAAAGAEAMIGDDAGRVMPMTLNFLVGGVDHSRMPDPVQLREMALKGDADTPALINTNLSCTSWARPGTLHFNAIRISGNTLDPASVSSAEAEGRRRVENYIAWLRAKVPGFENCYLVKTGGHIGVRESRRVVGDYVLSEADFRRCSKFEDGIACCAYPIDIHPDKPGHARIEHVPLGEFYHIPYRCLTPKGLTNLLIASRCISADRVAHGSMRIMPVVMNVGEAAGFAAAMSLPAGDVRKIDVQALRQKIRDNRGVLELKA